MTKAALHDAARYWERRRIGYNVALALMASAWLVVTWPHFRPALTFDSLFKLLILVLLANVCYTAAYLVDVPMQKSAFSARWRERRWILWLLGVLLALAIEYYWIADEIYPSVTGS